MAKHLPIRQVLNICQWIFKKTVMSLAPFTYLAGNTWPCKWISSDSLKKNCGMDFKKEPHARTKKKVWFPQKNPYHTRPHDPNMGGIRAFSLQTWPSDCFSLWAGGRFGIWKLFLTIRGYPWGYLVHTTLTHSWKRITINKSTNSLMVHIHHQLCCTVIKIHIDHSAQYPFTKKLKKQTQF